MFINSKAELLGRYTTYLEYAVIGSLLLLVASQLSVLLGVNVWRQDSMYYVVSYADKLISEGRWINFVLFKFLKLVPASICIVVSYFCLAYFVYSACQCILEDWRYSLALALLSLSVPVLTVQLEWPETLLVGFLLLIVAVNESRRLPDYVFFPLFACLFFGTFSAFYFLMPLLFLKDLNARSFVRLCIIWMLSFVFGYCVTNLIVYIASGNVIQISSWRDPHPIKHFSDLIVNINQIKFYFITHVKEYRDVVTQGACVAAAAYFLYRFRSVQSLWMLLVVLFCALSVYVTAIPLGIAVEERTELTFWLAALFVVFVTNNIAGFYRACGFMLMLVVGLKMAETSYASVSSYARVTDSMVNQIRLAIPYPTEEVNRTFIVVKRKDAQNLFLKIQRNIDYQRYFSEDFVEPLNWFSVFKYLGYKNLILCVDNETGWCTDATRYTRNLDASDPSGHLFMSYRVGDDIIFTVNQHYLREDLPVLKLF